MVFMMNKLAMINSCEIIFEKLISLLATSVSYPCKMFMKLTTLNIKVYQFIRVGSLFLLFENIDPGFLGTNNLAYLIVRSVMTRTREY